MAWYSHFLKNFPQFIVIHTVKGFGIVNKAEIDVFLELSCFFHDPADIGNLISGACRVVKWQKASVLELVCLVEKKVQRKEEERERKRETNIPWVTWKNNKALIQDLYCS